MYRLYWEHMAGSIVVQAVLERTGAPYAMDYVDMGAGAHQGEAFLQRNPAGRVPALTLPDGRTIGETAAIVTLLGERHPEAGVTPPPGAPERPDFLFWLSVMATAGYVTSSRVGHPERFAEDDSAIGQVKAQADRDYAAFFDLMEQAIAGEPFFLPGGPGALDFYLAMLAEWVGDRETLFASRPSLQRLCLAVRNTPAYAAALATHHMPRSHSVERSA